MNLLPAKRALGLLSMGLGVLAVVQPKRAARWLGLGSNPEAVASLGARELATGAALLSPVKPGRFLWFRVISSAVNLATLRKGLQPGAPNRKVALVASLTVATVGLVDLLMAIDATRHPRDDAAAAA
jgi:hypothetical protein